MGLTATVTGFVVFLLSVPVVQGLNDLGVTYASIEICALKGSTVDISCTYRYPSSIDGINITVVKQFWYIQAYVGLTTDSDYAGRTEYIFHEKNCTLRITDLSLVARLTYAKKQETQAIQVKVTRITVNSQSYTEAELNCNSSCSPDDPLSYVWLKNGQNVLQRSSSYTGRFSPGDNISCALTGHEGYPSPALYALKIPSVSVRPSGEIVEGSSVNLTCSGEANNVANYSWYTKNPLPNHELLNIEPQLVFGSIQSSDSGEYYCTAENELGRRASEYISINVKYAPRVPSVSVSPSGEIVEGSSVNLTCSSDANPAANYTWYKENQSLSVGPEGTYNFTSISSEDRGIYHCKSENQYGENSLSLFFDVQYPPELPSVSVSPSGEIVEGSSVNLTCSSDANPAATYTWYKEDEDSPKASGQIFTITDFRPEHSGNYSCEAQNRRGRHNSTLHLIVVARAGGKLAAAGTITVVLLAISLSVFLWIRKKRTSKESSEPEERADNREQLRTGQPEEQEDLQYASVHFSNNQADPLYSNIRAARPLRHMEQQEVIEYAAVSFNRASTAPRTRGQETGEDPAALYSTVNKTR